MGVRAAAAAGRGMSYAAAHTLLPLLPLLLTTSSLDPALSTVALQCGTAVRPACGTTVPVHKLSLVLVKVGGGADEEDAKHAHVKQHLADERLLLVQQAHACRTKRKKKHPYVKA